MLPGGRYTASGSALAVHMAVDHKNRVYACLVADDVPLSLAFSLLEEVRVLLTTLEENIRTVHGDVNDQKVLTFKPRMVLTCGHVILDGVGPLVQYAGLDIASFFRLY